ncbi:MAG: ABC transporter permease [Methanobrevibacter sp.]|jgi:putative ABC transport system permease protein|nr:ABC transporter permease [Candidatus Methanovirga basalitermitum]
MGLLFFSFALKNIFRNKWRSTFIIILLVIGIFALLFSEASSEISGNLLDNVINESMMNSSFGVNDNLSSLIRNQSLSNSDVNSIDAGVLANESSSLDSINMSNIDEYRKEMTKGVKMFFFYLNLFFVFIGSIIIMVAMLKAVGERTREIGVLKSIGWTNLRVSGLILLESLFQLFMAWFVVTVLLLIFYMTNGHTINETFVNTLHMNISIVYRIFAVTFLTSLFIPIIGVILPLLRVFRIKPDEAMRY